MSIPPQTEANRQSAVGRATPLPCTAQAARDRQPFYPHLRHNYVAHCIEGGFFLGGMAFVNANTVLPTMVQALGGSAWVVSLMPSIMWIGFLLPPIFTAHWIEQMDRYMPILLSTGILQRLPFLLAGLALLYPVGGLPWLGLAAVALAPLLSGLMGGISMTAWQQLVIRTVPENRRASLFAIRFIISCVIGIIAGHVVKVVLNRLPGAQGYGQLHVLAFICLMISYLVFSVIREPPGPSAPPPCSPGLLENLKAMPTLVRSSRDFLFYLLARFFRSGQFILIPFLAIHAQTVLGKPESYVGQLVVAQFAGAVIGNLLAAYTGDRIGGKIVMLGGTGSLAASMGWAALAGSDLEFQIIFFLVGLGMYGSEVGMQILAMEISPADKRSSYLAIAALVNLPGLLLASWVSAALWEPGRHYLALCMVSLTALMASVLLLLPAKEPRRACPAD